MKKSIKKLSIRKDVVCNLQTLKEEIKGGKWSFGPECQTNYWGGCPLQTNERDRNTYYIC